MPRKRPPFVELWRDRHGKLRTYGRTTRKARRISLPDFGTPEFWPAYSKMLTGQVDPTAGARRPGVAPGTLGALVLSYLKSEEYATLKATTKKGYATRIEILRTEHGQRSVSGLTRERIQTVILHRYADRPGAALSLLKMLRILIRHAMSLDERNLLKLRHDPSTGIKRPKIREIRAWTDAETSAYEARWPLGKRQRTAYALMLYAGAARGDVHRMTWRQAERFGIDYVRNKTGVSVEVLQHKELQLALAAAPREHVTILNTEFGKPFTVAGFSQFMRNAITEAGLPLECKPHGLRKTLGRRMADAGCSAHEIMAALGHRTLEEAERYTREADRRLGGRQAIVKLEAHKANIDSQTVLGGLGKMRKSKGETT